MLGPHDRPDRTHMVIWITSLGSDSGAFMNVLQANCAKRHKTHKKTLRWLMDRSYVMPVTLVRGSTCQLWQDERMIIQWQSRDFISLDFDSSHEKIIGARIVPHAEALRRREARGKWREAMMAAHQEETDPERRKIAKDFLEGRFQRWLGPEE